MKTDKKLLELAAKAAGIDMQHRAMFGGDAEPGYYKYPIGVPPLWTWWNPLADDGDALRLAVKLDITINCDNNRSTSWTNNARGVLTAEVLHDDGVNFDPYAATRRAIVCAAAATGEMTP